ncbi:hypothetical protein HZA57_08445, partial [Candidatus Poribacteria bacterium]|nr:hypothetical protein [Candidatus Poribacteria bacterium]
TAAGAFVLTENSLYTLEAWDVFLDHLSDDGILTFSRWYFNRSPNETYRLVALASESLRRAGIESPREHMMIAKTPFQLGLTRDEDRSVATLLVSKKPFSAGQVATIESVCARMKFDVVMTPSTCPDPVLARIASGENLDEFLAQHPVNLAPPTDDSPFFFNMLRPRDFFNEALINESALQFNEKAVSLLVILLITVTILTVLGIFVPLALTMRTVSLKGGAPWFIYFAGIGLGFMLVEIALMQKLNVFLGHPVYGLAVVLFSLLVSSGIGSFLTDRMAGERTGRAGLARLAALLAVVGVLGLVVTPAIHAFQAATTPARILVSVLLLSPAGLFMGMAFPAGMKLATVRHERLTPWLWGINGAMSVLASVLAVLIALSFSISAAYWCGWVCYAVAVTGFAVAGRQANAYPTMSAASSTPSPL